MAQQLLIATRNPGKLAEFRSLLAGIPFDLVSLADCGIAEECPETGATFSENAISKAVCYAERSGLKTLADDSGLVVDALGGEPGVYSARYGGPGLDDVGRYRYLLRRLEGVPGPQRTAQFRACIAVASPDGSFWWSEGACHGIIADAPRGTFGFGYDPVFYLPDRGMTMAELPPEVKNSISHRAMAARAVRQALVEGNDP
ncbi:MAG: RdgB/HAM1 family non-canonical purine NTP pyrophosphatase [Chloroflexi bacterium]|nr:RdgB/HAM1 family non-canonical purine NTP pyrophosphatase [Chloroflexota bacterium]